MCKSFSCFPGILDCSIIHWMESWYWSLCFQHTKIPTSSLIRPLYQHPLHYYLYIAKLFQEMVAGARMAEEKHIKHSFMSNTNSTVCSERKTGLRNNPHLSFDARGEEASFYKWFCVQGWSKTKIKEHSQRYCGYPGLPRHRWQDFHSRVRAVYFGTAVASPAPMWGRLPCSWGCSSTALVYSSAY